VNLIKGSISVATKELPMTDAVHFEFVLEKKYIGVVDTQLISYDPTVTH
jgi:hypothetical protein